MQTKKTQHRSPLAGLFWSTCAAALIAAAAPQVASAAPGSAQNAKILNVVTVTYYDATGTNQHTAATSTSITVALKAAPLSVATAVTFPSVDSGSTTTSYVALTANANGSDGYLVNFSHTPTNLTTPTTVTTRIVTDITGGTASAIATGGTVTLGATSIVSVGAGGASQVINIPGGALNGIAAGSVVVINGTSYKVTATTAGSPATYSQTGAQFSTGTYQAEVYGTITIAKDPNGSNVDPSLSGSLAGTIVGERKYLEIADRAVVSSNTANGTDSFAVSTDTVSGGNVAALAANDIATFYYVAVSINKTVVNVTNGAAGATGKPGDVLEYTVTVVNATSGNAGVVSVADAVPAYTTLISGASSLGTTLGTGAATEKFATITDGTSTVDATLNPSDSETQPGGGNVGFGGTAGNAVTAGAPINFYLGTASAAGTGGTIAAGKSYTIKYRVMIN